MGNIKVTVTVGNVIPPTPINVLIQNTTTGATLYDDTAGQTFTKNYPVPPALYTVIVSGTNQENDSTDIAVGGDFSLPDATHENGPMYITPFIGNVSV